MSVEQDEVLDPIAEAVKAAAAAENSLVKSMPVEIVSKRSGPNFPTNAYYLATEKIQFRDEGEIEKAPSKLYLEDLKSRKDVLVYYSSSGSGKTAELVGSSATRGCHLAMIVTVQDPSVSTYDAFYTNGEMEGKMGSELEQFVNKLAADAAILDGLKELVSRAKETLRPVVEAAVPQQGAYSDAPPQLKIVLAIDEGASCPRLIRGILRFPKVMKTLVSEAISQGLDLQRFDDESLDVKVSVAGTGVASSTIGSLPENSGIKSPYHEKNWETVMKSKLRSEDLKVSVPWSVQKETITMEVIKKYLPVLYTMIQNGRMASITIAKLRACANNDEEIKECSLVDQIVKKFMESNGMKELAEEENGKKRRTAAAAALAIHLFRSMNDTFKIRVPEESSKVADWASQMDFWKFSKCCELQGICVRKLVQKYGLLEPAERVDESEKGETIFPPLKMTPPQQLIATFMLGISMDNMLQPTWFGFEMMSTHFVKCAIAASATVCQTRRPSVQDTLTCLGFTIDENSTSNDVKKTWITLGNWVPYSTVATRELTPYHSNTRQLDVGLAIVEGTGESGCEELLRVETTLLDSLTNTRIGNDVQDDYVGPPIACVNEGNSPFCDGIVAFFAKPKGRKGVEVEELLSIMVQAKDYHGKSGISASNLNKHAEVVGSKRLDRAFGKTRLLCVASTHASLIAKKPVMPRKFLPFAFNRGSLLSSLLEELKEQRSERSRIAKYASSVDKDGKVVQGFGEGPRQQKSKKAADQGKKEKKGAASTGKKTKNAADTGTEKKWAKKAKTRPY